MDKHTIPATFLATAKSRGDQIAMRHKAFGLWKEISWNMYREQATWLAHALMELGVQPNDFVGIIGENCPEWLYMDMGIQMAGAKTVGIYTTSAWQQVQFIVNHAECRILFAENEEQVDKWLHMKAGSPSVEYVIFWDKKGLQGLKEEGVLWYDDFMEKGKQSYHKDPTRHLSRVQAIKPEDLALLVYTSGTTGLPKGAMLTNRNLLWVAKTLLEEKEVDRIISKEDETMSFLPLCHIFERMFSVYLPLIHEYTVNFAEGTDTIAQNMQEIRPTVGYAVPRVWEKFQSSMLIKMRDAPWMNRIAYKEAVKIGKRYIDLKLAKEKMDWRIKFRYFMAYWLVLFPLKYMVGMNRMKVALSGAAPISKKMLRFYHMLGITMIEGYGMTETSCLITISRNTDFRLGSVGKPLIGAEVKLNADGEILVKHPGVIKGYYKNQAASEGALIHGWMHTGDIGTFDDDGFLHIVDRKKDLIITAGGKNIAPQFIEKKLKFSPYINDAIVIGDKRKFISAIIVLDEENVNKFAIDHKIQYAAYKDLAKHPSIINLIDHEVKQVNAELARVESVRKFTILDKRLYEEDGEVTPTMKVKRKFINEQYKDLIESMYR